jgi:AraC-like DNA-binding protein
MELKLKDYLTSELPFSVIAWSHNSDFPEHTHDYYELVVVFSGSARHLFDKKECIIGPGDTFLIPPKTLHAYRAPKHLSFVNIIFDKGILPLSDLQLIPGFHALFTVEPNLRQGNAFNTRLKLESNCLSEVSRLSIKISDEFDNKPPGYSSLAYAIFVELLFFIVRRVRSSDSKAHRSVLIFSKITGFIENNYHKKITLQEMASLANMSPRNFQRTFKEVFRMSPIQYLIRLRLERAARFLTDKDTSIGEAAAKAGICDSNYFARIFKEKYNITPQQYRACHKKA